MQGFLVLTSQAASFFPQAMIFRSTEGPFALFVERYATPFPLFPTAVGRSGLGPFLDAFFFRRIWHFWTLRGSPFICAHSLFPFLATFFSNLFGRLKTPPRVPTGLYFF